MCGIAGRLNFTGEDARPGYVDELLSRGRISADGLFHPVAVENLVQKFRDGRAIGMKDNMALTGILSTQLIVDQFVRRFEGRSTGE